MNLKGLKEFLGVWWKLMARPIYFYTFIEKSGWKERSLSFLLSVSWTLALFISASALAIQLIWILLGLVSGVTGLKFLIILPVFAALCAMFVFIIFLITGAFVFAASFVGFGVLSVINDAVFRLFYGKSDIKESAKAFFYSSGVLLFSILIFFMAVLVRYKALSFANFATGANIVMVLSLVYAWGLWSIASRKIYRTGKTISVLLTLISVLIVILLIAAADIKLLPALERWIS